MTKRTNPTPARGTKMPSGVHAMRRGGARREVTERVTLRTSDGAMLEGWALNVSRGGLRVILEDKVALGQKFEICIGTEDVLQRPGRVVWLQEEPDGVIVGLEFVTVAALPSSGALPADGDARPNGDASGVSLGAARAGDDGDASDP